MLWMSSYIHTVSALSSEQSNFPTQHSKQLIESPPPSSKPAELMIDVPASHAKTHFYNTMSKTLQPVSEI